MFDRMAVDSDCSDGRHPLVMHLVDVLVDCLVVQKSGMGKGNNISGTALEIELRGTGH